VTPSAEKNKSEVTVNIQKKEECRIELEVQASKECVLQARKQALKSLSKEIELPGFRKGKAPENLLLKKYGKAFEEEWKKSIADRSFVEAQKTVTIPPPSSQGSIHYNMKSYSLEEGAFLTFTYETEPEVPSIDLSHFTLDAIQKPEVGQKQIDEAIRQSRFFYAKWKEIENRPVQEGDYVIIDLDSMEGETPQTVFSKTRFEVSDRGMAQWMKNLLIGAKLQEIIEGISAPDDDLPEEEKKKFEPKKVRITLLKIEEASLPDLNEEFAKKMGLKNVEELQQWITNHLNKQAEEKVHQEEHNQVCRFLLKNASFDLPSSLIHTEKNYRIRSALENPRFKESWEKMSREEKEKVEKNIAQEAIDAIKLFYISRKVVEDAKITITQDQIIQEASHLFAEKHGRSAHPQDINKDLYALAFSRIILRHAEEYLLKLASQK
jgi:trigger factor